MARRAKHVRVTTDECWVLDVCILAGVDGRLTDMRKEIPLYIPYHTNQKPRTKRDHPS
jgi:hypothetical protein